jgi:hypothetical protein
MAGHSLSWLKTILILILCCGSPFGLFFQPPFYGGGGDCFCKCHGGCGCTLLEHWIRTVRHKSEVVLYTEHVLSCIIVLKDTCYVGFTTCQVYKTILLIFLKFLLLGVLYLVSWGLCKFLEMFSEMFFCFYLHMSPALKGNEGFI